MKPAPLVVGNQTALLPAPTLEEVSPRYSRVVVKERELHARKEETQAQVKVVVADLSKMPPPAPISSSAVRVELFEPSPIAKKLLGELGPEPRTEIINAGHPLRRRGIDLGEQLEAIE